MEDKKPTKYMPVALTKEVIEKIDCLREQIHAHKPGVFISRGQLVNWLIQRMPEVFPDDELNALVEHFYDRSKHLRRLLREAKKAEAGQ